MKVNKKLSILVLPLVMASATLKADNVVNKVRHAGPFRISQPIVLDSIDNTQKRFAENTMADNAINTPLSLDIIKQKPLADVKSLKLDSATLNIVGFDINAKKYLKNVQMNIKGSKKYKVFVDGKEASSSLTLQPGYHSLCLKFIADSTGLEISLPTEDFETLNDGMRRFTMTDVLGTRVTSRASLSPSGRWALINYSWYDKTNKREGEQLLVDLKTGAKRFISENASWMPSTDRYYYTKTEDGKKHVITFNPATGEEKVIVDNMTADYFFFSPTEDFLILQPTQEGPRKENGVFEIVHPDDRQPGWRTRYSLAKMDIASGLVQPLTYTYHNVNVDDISIDGRHLLFSVASDSLIQRPTTRLTYYDLDLVTMEKRMLVEKDGFIGRGIYAGGPDKIVFKASTEAFNGIGNRVPEGRTPNTFDYHLYLMDTATRNVTPLTADDATSINDIDYSHVDHCIYYTAQNGDSVSLYRVDPKTLRSIMVRQPMEVLNGLSIAQKGGNIMVHGSSASQPYEVYNITSPAKNPKATLAAAPNKEMFKDLKVGTTKPWKFMTSRGYEVTGFYNLPADFDSEKKYPVIVHYYGGCSPTSRRFGNGSHYPTQYWNALGYIVFTVNPSGASGFGQEWASRHVNTMGEGVAQDIIDATRQFVKDVPQCDADHIGCVSASYGGFMTQYMMTKDNPFACGVSHAGISDHTSYWGEGYWGYSYSETSAANSYPWTRKDLFVDRSPLYLADKIHKPILFTHGTADTNVPIGESIQMYTALRLLGIPTAFVQVEGENHGIMDPVKRTSWINTIVAWFDLYLKGDDSWWNAIYSPKKL